MHQVVKTHSSWYFRPYDQWRVAVFIHLIRQMLIACCFHQHWIPMTSGIIWTYQSIHHTLPILYYYVYIGSIFACNETTVISWEHIARPSDLTHHFIYTVLYKLFIPPAWGIHEGSLVVSGLKTLWPHVCCVSTCYVLPSNIIIYEYILKYLVWENYIWVSVHWCKINVHRITW